MCRLNEKENATVYGLFKRDKARGEQGGGDGETTIRQHDEWTRKCAVCDQ